MNNRRIGVTLVEVVIAIVIIGVVVVILFPTIQHKRYSSYQSPCQANLKQIGLGFIQYIQDYDEKWPGGFDHWAGEIYPYIKSRGAYRCPDDIVDKNDTGDYVSYAMNSNLAGRWNPSLTKPEYTVAACDFDGGAATIVSSPERTSPYTTGAPANRAWGGVRLGTTESVPNPPRHDPALMFLACDGHAKLLRPELVSSGASQSTVIGQDAVHAAGTGYVTKSTTYRLTFSAK